ncbi:hypothetical protein EDC04DRAFT_2607016 [Pisolithus marmoratus]|nr:hypothetical protein EDC04DRAFT_2607016 [Pisolithus marmoratus]
MVPSAPLETPEEYYMHQAEKARKWVQQSEHTIGYGRMVITRSSCNLSVFHVWMLWSGHSVVTAMTNVFLGNLEFLGLLGTLEKCGSTRCLCFKPTEGLELWNDVYYTKSGKVWNYWKAGIGIAGKAWKSTLKAEAHEYVVWHYPLGGNQQAEENLANVQELIWGVKFVRDGYYKEHGITSSDWPHHRIFYTGPSALSSLFPEVFAWEVPKPVVCPAAMVLQATIDEYVIMGIWQDCQLESSTYLKVFMQLMAMQAKIDGNHKHATMTQALRIGWATTRSALCGGKTMITSEDDFEVVLD